MGGGPVRVVLVALTLPDRVVEGSGRGRLQELNPWKLEVDCEDGGGVRRGGGGGGGGGLGEEGEGTAGAA